MSGNKGIKAIPFFLLLVPLMSGEMAFAQSSANYTLSRSVVDAGGNASQSANYSALDVTGQPSPVGDCTGSNYCLYSGFLGGVFTTGSITDPWYEQPSGVDNRLTSVSVVSDQTVWIAGYNCILRTTDGGNFWDNVAGGIDTLRFISGQALSEDTLLVTGFSPSLYNSGIYRSWIYRTTNGGTTWNEVSDPDQFINKIAMFDDMNGLAIGDVVDQNWFMLQTTDGGITWNPRSPPLGGNDYAYCGGDASFYSDGHNTIFFVSSDNHYYWSEDRGQNWNSVFVDVPSPPTMRSIAADNTGTVLLGGRLTNRLFRSNDCGTSWTEITSPSVENVMYLNYYDNRFWLLIGGEIYASSDAGDSWESETACDDYLRDIDLFTYNNALYSWAVGDNGTILKYFGDVTPVEKEDLVHPVNMTLLQNHPNPFNVRTTIRFHLKAPVYTELKIYNIRGNEIETLVSEFKDAGVYTYHWDASDLPSGIYLYRLKAGNYLETKKLVLQK